MADSKQSITPNNELQLLQGTWAVETLEIEGLPMPAAGRITIKGSKFTTEAMGAEYKGNITAQDGKIDLHFTSGPEKGNTNPGIFKLKGDTLKLCLALTSPTRPTRFKTSPGTGLALETLVREGGKASKKSAAASVSLPETFEPAPEIEGDWQLISAVMNGQPLPKEYVKSGKRTAVNNEFRVVVMGQTMIHAHFAITRTTEPRQIDYYVHGPGNKLLLQYGIWTLEDDRLTTAIGTPGSPRPAAFEPGPGVTLTCWQRVPA